MARLVPITSVANELTGVLTKTLQSGHINFLLGSGASMPAIKTAGNIEAELDALEDDDQEAFQQKRFEFLSEIQASTNDIVSAKDNASNTQTLSNYRAFLESLLRALEERKTDLLPRQATVFTTNYDLFLERAAEKVIGLRLNDGFLRGPSVRNGFRFRPDTFSDITYKKSTLYRNRVPVPIVNLVKLHGSLSWKVDGEDLVYSVAARAIPAANASAAEMASFADEFAIVMPTHRKFEQTLIDRTYYDLLRSFANALDVENSPLISFGFSFDDAHICDIVTKALKNPTLLLIIVAHSADRVDAYKAKFESYNNVLIVHPEEGETIEFSGLNDLLIGALPKASYD